MIWQEHQAWEANWWGDCLNTFGEEVKQLTYAHRLGLQIVPAAGQWPVYDLGGSNILDVGGGPVSMLLKCSNRGPGCAVVDPCRYPDWIYDRYDVARVEYFVMPAEEFSNTNHQYQEAWMYNVLQHVQDPEKVVYNAMAAAPVVRIFEWLEVGVCDGHPNNLHENELNGWLGARSGMVEQMTGENGCHGLAYYFTG